GLEWALGGVGIGGGVPAAHEAFGDLPRFGVEESHLLLLRGRPCAPWVWRSKGRGSAGRTRRARPPQRSAMVAQTSLAMTGPFGSPITRASLPDIERTVTSTSRALARSAPTVQFSAPSSATGSTPKNLKAFWWVILLIMRSGRSFTFSHSSSATFGQVQSECG